MNYTAFKPGSSNTEFVPDHTQVPKMSVLSMIACSIFIVFVLYGDGLGILSEFPILTNNAVMKYVETDKDSSVIVGDLKLSLPKLLFTFFNAGGVFNKIPDNNIEYALYGRHVNADPTKPWEDLSFIKNCFPYDCRGEINTRLDFSWQNILGQTSYSTAMNDLLAKIKDKYNREHPQNPVDKIAIYIVWWPRSEYGFYKLKQPETTHFQLLGEE